MIDVDKIITIRLISQDIAGGNVFVANVPEKIKDLPVVVVSLRQQTGNYNLGLFTRSIQATCIDTTDTGVEGLAQSIIRLLDGWGGDGVKHVEHTLTSASFVENTNPVLFTRVVVFDVIYQDFRK